LSNYNVTKLNPCHPSAS